MHTNDSKDKLSKLGKGKSGKLEGRMSLEEAQRSLEEAHREGIPLAHLVISPGYGKRSGKQPETGTPGSSTGPTKPGRK